eukprot:CAMPEP_0179142588 /NCGR_PEP_ID=MMETSP0796-20121207/68492_1 /TAXON_ID=73915 /ORGANISM="Pyrodinium bahamense, Strain pbaha01" /LENGTH=42 /DNA_ID= /DNA_START= /DNA_END= /DNA_ORIENTATION=
MSLLEDSAHGVPLCFRVAHMWLPEVYPRPDGGVYVTGSPDPP